MILLVSFTLFKIVSDIFIYWENKPIAHIQCSYIIPVFQWMRLHIVRLTRQRLYLWRITVLTT